MDRKEIHYLPLDGVRGLAILAVFCNHYGGGRKFSSPILWVIGQIMASGWIGVDLFFALSGFLITGILLDSREDTHYFRNFYARRTLRIFPIYYGVLFALLVMTPVFHIPWDIARASYFIYVQNIVQVFRDPHVSILGPIISLGPFWSLAVEEQFYLIWPLLVRMCRTDRRMLLLFAIAIAGPALCRVLTTSEQINYNLTTHRLDELAIGGLLAFLIRRTKILQLPAAIPGSIIAVCAVLLGLICWHENSAFWSNLLMQRAGFVLLGLGSSALIWWTLLPGSLAARLFAASPLRFFGRYSYGIYIYHGLFSGPAHNVVYPWLFRKMHSAIPATATFFFGFLALYAGVAFISYHAFEKHFLRLKKYFTYQRVERPAGIQAGTVAQ